jgi:hypothetical protein
MGGNGMRYYAKYDDSSVIIAIGTGDGGDEISEEEYQELLAQFVEKSRLVEMVFNGEITLDDVPSQWREEVQRRSEELKANAALCEDDVSAEDALAELVEVLE